MDEEVHRVAGMYLMLTKQGPIFLADTTVNIDPTVDELVEITNVVAKAVQKFNITPRIAMLSYSNFGSSETGNPVKVRQAVEKLHKIYPDMIVDGEMQANFALNEELLKDNYPFSTLVGGAANTLIFPNLDSGNAAYKILQEIGGAEAVGPILIGMKKPVHILQLGSSVREIVNMITIAVVDAQSKEEDIESAKSTPKVKRGIFRKN
jgi:malate dehydrogenase (oxaloacetate-decarboxylating)(NADP+)